MDGSIDNLDIEVSLAAKDIDAIEQKVRQENYLAKKQDRLQRKELANKIYNLVKYYFFGVFVLLLLSGCHNHFVLSDNVLITLLGTTTVNVLAILVIVVTYFFHIKKN